MPAALRELLGVSEVGSTGQSDGVWLTLDFNAGRAEAVFVSTEGLLKLTQTLAGLYENLSTKKTLSGESADYVVPFRVKEVRAGVAFADSSIVLELIGAEALAGRGVPIQAPGKPLHSSKRAVGHGYYELPRETV
jgi:hypothetical protein